MTEVSRVDYKNIKLWIILFAVAIGGLVVSGYQSGSNDSRFYSDLIWQLKDKPVEQWIAPTWQNHYGRPFHKPIRDHLLGHIFTGLVVHKMGIPYKHALQLICLFYQLSSIFLLFLIARKYFKEEKSSVVFWALQLIPIAFIYGVRTNHEQALLFFILLAVYGAIELVDNFKMILLIWISAVAVFLIKGIVVLMVPIAAILTYLLSEKKLISLKSAFYILLIILSYAFVYGAGLIYEKAYFSVTGMEFFSEYFRVQIGERTIGTEGQGAFIIKKVKNFFYYLSRTSYYTAPWSFWALYLFFKNKLHLKLIQLVKKYFSLERYDTSRFFVIFFVLVLFYIAAFSTSNRTASRYIFHVYYFAATLALMALMEYSIKLQRFHQKILSKGVIKVSALIWIAAIFINIIAFLFRDPYQPYDRVPHDI